ncbi:MAG: hypothetical protein LBH59_04100 [Planctomycetaceae bacterium]|nr:hypothetical protein [Planctomycetaceae bacterium]
MERLFKGEAYRPYRLRYKWSVLFWSGKFFVAITNTKAYNTILQLQRYTQPVYFVNLT